MTSDELVDVALSYAGRPAKRYRGPELGCGEEGWFDCSGFITFLFRTFNFPNPLGLRHCNEYFDLFGIAVHPQFRKKGDLVFFTYRGIMPAHIGLCISPDSYIHASTTDGYVKVDPLVTETIQFLASRDDFESRIKGKRTQKYFQNPIGFKRPAIRKGRYAFEIE